MSSEVSSEVSSSVSGKIYLGCSGWSYPSWRPGFYPAKTPIKHLLSTYSQRLNAVEVNYTFRSLPSASTIANWLQQTPEHFRFALKAPQRITHSLRLKDAGAALETFANAIAPLREAARLGPVLFQLPPNLPADSLLLADFMAQVSRLEIAAAFEFRNPGWFTDATYTALAEHNVALCAAESDTLRSPDIETSPRLRVYRLRRTDYTADELTDIAGHFAELARAGADVYGFFMHEEAPDGPLRASRVLASIAEELRG